LGMDPDLAEAARLFRQGCDGGAARGCTGLGFLHHQGLGMDPDLAEAARLYRQGCDGGLAIACDQLKRLGEE
ncbi:MAG: HcpA family protein, partial [Pseudomonadota bacterium]